jgi:hypothetical protein
MKRPHTALASTLLELGEEICRSSACIAQPHGAISILSLVEFFRTRYLRSKYPIPRLEDNSSQFMKTMLESFRSPCAYELPMLPNSVILLKGRQYIFGATQPHRDMWVGSFRW